MALVVAEDHRLRLGLRGRDLGVLLMLVALSVVDFLLGAELLDAVAVHLEFVVAEASFVLSGVLILRHGRVEVENVLVWRLELTEQIGDVGVVHAGGLLVRTVLRLLGLAAGGQLQLVDDVLPQLSLIWSESHRWLGQELVRVVLRVGMLGEVLHVLLGDGRVQISEVMEGALGEELQLLPPNDGHAHVLTRVGNDCAGQQVRVDRHEALLVEAEVGEELCILLEVLGQLWRWLLQLSRRLVFVALPASGLEDLLVLEEATLRDEELHVVVDREHHQLPVQDVEHLAFHRDDEVAVVSIAHLVVQSICSWILDLQVLCRDQKAHERDQNSVILLVLGKLGGVDVHEVNSVMDGLVVTLQGVSDIAEVVYPLDPFL